MMEEFVFDNNYGIWNTVNPKKLEKHATTMQFNKIFVRMD
jgi:hypothetical protein